MGDPVVSPDHPFQSRFNSIAFAILVLFIEFIGLFFGDFLEWLSPFIFNEIYQRRLFFFIMCLASYMDDTTDMDRSNTPIESLSGLKQLSRAILNGMSVPFKTLFPRNRKENDFHIKLALIYTYVGMGVLQMTASVWDLWTNRVHWLEFLCEVFRITLFWMGLWIGHKFFDDEQSYDDRQMIRPDGTRDRVKFFFGYNPWLKYRRNYKSYYRMQQENKLRGEREEKEFRRAQKKKKREERIAKRNAEIEKEAQETGDWSSLLNEPIDHEEKKMDSPMAGVIEPLMSGDDNDGSSSSSDDASASDSAASHERDNDEKQPFIPMSADHDRSTTLSSGSIQVMIIGMIFSIISQFLQFKRSKDSMALKTALICVWFIYAFHQKQSDTSKQAFDAPHWWNMTLKETIIEMVKGLWAFFILNVNGDSANRFLMCILIFVSTWEIDYFAFEMEESIKDLMSDKKWALQRCTERWDAFKSREEKNRQILKSRIYKVMYFCLFCIVISLVDLNHLFCLWKHDKRHSKHGHASEHIYSVRASHRGIGEYGMNVVRHGMYWLLVISMIYQMAFFNRLWPNKIVQKIKESRVLCVPAIAESQKEGLSKNMMDIEYKRWLDYFTDHVFKARYGFRLFGFPIDFRWFAPISFVYLFLVLYSFIGKGKLVQTLLMAEYFCETDLWSLL